MKNLLTKTKDDNILAELYSDKENPDNFHISYILSMDDFMVLECNVGLHGEFDGYCAERIDDIYKVETDTKYIEKIKSLMERSFECEDIQPVTDNPLKFIINMAVEKEYVAVICLESQCVTGYIKKFENDMLYMKEVSDYGISSGDTEVCLKDILKIMVNDTDARDIDYLFKKTVDKL